MTWLSLRTIVFIASYCSRTACLNQLRGLPFFMSSTPWKQSWILVSTILKYSGSARSLMLNLLSSLFSPFRKLVKKEFFLCLGSYFLYSSWLKSLKLLRMQSPGLWWKQTNFKALCWTLWSVILSTMLQKYLISLITLLLQVLVSSILFLINSRLVLTLFSRMWCTSLLRPDNGIMSLTVRNPRMIGDTSDLNMRATGSLLDRLSDSIDELLWTDRQMVNYFPSLLTYFSSYLWPSFREAICYVDSKYQALMLAHSRYTCNLASSLWSNWALRLIIWLSFCWTVVECSSRMSVILASYICSIPLMMLVWLDTMCLLFQQKACSSLDSIFCTLIDQIILISYLTAFAVSSMSSPSTNARQESSHPLFRHLSNSLRKRSSWLILTSCKALCGNYQASRRFEGGGCLGFFLKRFFSIGKPNILIDLICAPR